MSDSILIAPGSAGIGSKRSIPSLDGLRAISISFVLFAHLWGTQHFPAIPVEYFGLFGVRVFFVISGYLITSILLDELKREGSISLSRFYFRRTMRLFPAAYLYIAVIAVLAAKHLVQLEHSDLSFAVTYTMNFYDARGWPLGHLWSLAVEEQFYLLWPLTLRTLGTVRSVRFLIGIVAIAPLLRLASPLVGPAFNFFIWSDALAAGCLLALLRRTLATNDLYSRVLGSRWFFLVPMAAVLANYVPSTKLQWLFCGTIMNITIAITVDWAMRNPGGLVGRFLNYPPIRFIGVLSYSWYLWQQVFLDRYSNSVYCAFPVNIILSFVMALASYFLVESPFLRLRSAIERASSRAHKGQLGATGTVESGVN
jgi:peptidoglycan/LPS O-acetylase OafA/YrhL